MGKGSSGATFCEVLIAILLPPLGVFLKYACGVRSIFFLCLLEPTVVDVLVAVEVPHVAFGSFEKLFHIFSVSVWNACIGYITDWRERFASLFAVLKVSGYNSIEFQDDVFVLLTILFGSLQLGLDSFDCSWSFGYASSWPSLVTFPASCTLSMWSWHRERGAGTPPSLASSAWTGWSVQKFSITAKVVKPKTFSYQEKGGKGVKDNGWSKIKWRVRLFFIMLYKKNIPSHLLYKRCPSCAKVDVKS